MHQNSKASKRYAKALLTFAKEQKSADTVAEDMELIASVCSASKELITLLKSPVVKTDKKKAILDGIFAGKIGSVSQKFLEVMARHNRENLLPEIANAFKFIYRESKGIVTAEIHTAVPLTEDGRKKALAFVSTIYEKAELTEKIDKSLIGGFIIRVGDKQYDESVARKLTSLKREFSKNPYIAEL
ncbi:MAG: ATP synthase F1 subunit delta [Flavobacteriales bacterium]|nr:ATP synthase F1 subunit delta [Flavobacteriales bacterium]